MLEHIPNNSMYSTDIQIPMDCFKRDEELYEEYYKLQYEILFINPIQDNLRIIEQEEDEFESILKKENL